MNNLIDGKMVSEKLKKELLTKILELKEKLMLVVIQVGNNEASNVYVNKKINLCKELGIESVLLKYESISENDLLGEIDKLNNDSKVTGILVQLPLPKEINEEHIIEKISYLKDVDGLTSTNLGKLYSNEKGIVPCTALGIIKLLDYYNVPLEGKNVCIIGRSKLVGIPLFKLLLDRNCTVTMCHSKTNNLKEITKQSDILVVAVGKRNIITKDMIRDDSVIIDVGINRIDNKLYGDVDYQECVNVARLITPVPGGVGPMTVVCLMNNCMECYKLQKYKD